MNRAALIVVLGEDKNKRQQNLVRKYLRKRGFTDRQIRDVPCPVGETPGITFVKSQFVTEVQELRKATYSRGLVIAIDADDKTVDDRKNELLNKLRDAEEATRGAQEAIAIVVPRRNVETWIWYLDGNVVDEFTNYKRTSVKDNYDSAGAKRAFAEYIVSGQAPFDDCPPSLEDARVELARIPHS